MCTAMYEVWLTRDAERFYQGADDPLARRLNRCFDQLRRNPHEHPNMKPLKGPFAGCWRYRVGDWQVAHRVEEVRKRVGQMGPLLVLLTTRSTLALGADIR